MTEVPWITLNPNTKNTWITEGLQADFENFLPIGSKEAKAQQALEVQAIFKTYSSGIQTNRDDWMYDFNIAALRQKAENMITTYNDEIDRWKQAGYPKGIDNFVLADETRIKWCSRLKEHFVRKQKTDVATSAFRDALYRPFTRKYLYFDNVMTHRQAVFPKIFPTALSEQENAAICLNSLGNNKPFHGLMTNHIADLHLTGDSQCFPLYTYALDGKIRRDNVTDWALAQFQAQYGPDVTKRDIFHYVYGLLHSPEYRERYKENLKRELPRIPLVGGEDSPTPGTTFLPLPPQAGEGLGAGLESSLANLHPSPGTGEGSAGTAGGGGLSPFRRFATAGAALAALHVGYETAEEYPLEPKVNKDVPFSWRVSKMRLSKDKTAVVVNEALTLAGVPPEVFEYKLGNRSALEWVLDQYQVSTDKRSGIETDPNREGDPEYIVRLVRRVVTVSVETVKIVGALPNLTMAPA